MPRAKLAPPDIVILAGGVAMLVGSFLAFYQQTVTSPFDGSSVTFSLNAWDRGLFMIVTLPALLGMFMALQVALKTFSNIDMPSRVLSLTWDQFHLVVSVQCALLMLAFLAAAQPLDFGVGFWVMLVAAVALVVGALLRLVASRRRPRAI
jgi:general stress protein CsbA